MNNYKYCPLPYVKYLPPLLIKYLNKLKNSDEVIEIGCGEGAFLFAIINNLNKQKLKIRLTGLDIQKEKIVHAKKYLRYPMLKLIVADATKPNPAYNKHYNLVISYHVIEHIEDQVSLFNNIKRIINNDGLFYATSVIKKPYAVWIYRKNGKFVLDPTHIIEYETPEQYYKIFTDNGFKVIEHSLTQFHLPLTMLFEKIFLSLGIITPDKITSLQMNNKLYQKLKKIRIPVVGYKMIHAVLRLNA